MIGKINMVVYLQINVMFFRNGMSFVFRRKLCLERVLAAWPLIKVSEWENNALATRGMQLFAPPCPAGCITLPRARR
jgi:hypothetical protein